MSLQIGQEVGSYQISSLIGKGGMGEVYRARDFELKRDVAIKILPEAAHEKGIIHRDLEPQCEDPH